MASEDRGVDSLSGCLQSMSLLGLASQGPWAAAVGVLQAGYEGDGVGSEGRFSGSCLEPGCPGGVSPSGFLPPTFPPPRLPSTESLHEGENKPG